MKCDSGVLTTPFLSIDDIQFSVIDELHIYSHIISTQLVCQIQFLFIRYTI